MKNVKKISAAIVISALFTSVSMPVWADEITFEGSVTDSSCVVPANEMTRTITLAKISPVYLSAANEGDDVATETFNFNITGCPSNVSNVGVNFTFSPDATSTQYLSNTGTATGVLLGITDGSDQLVANNASIMSDNYDEVTGSGTVNAKVKAYRTSGAVASGTIASTANIVITTN
jgi:type 1 fimbria pilin